VGTGGSCTQTRYPGHLYVSPGFPIFRIVWQRRGRAPEARSTASRRGDERGSSRGDGGGTPTICIYRERRKKRPASRKQYGYKEGRGTRRTAWAPKGEEPRPNANELEPQETHPHRAAKVTAQQATADNLRPPQPRNKRGRARGQARQLAPPLAKEAAAGWVTETSPTTSRCGNTGDVGGGGKETPPPPKPARKHEHDIPLGPKSEGGGTPRGSKE
jgi:hypothetical protein